MLIQVILKSALSESWMAHSPNSSCISTLFLKKIFIGVDLIYNVVLISAAQQNESVINIKHS